MVSDSAYTRRTEALQRYAYVPLQSGSSINRWTPQFIHLKGKKERDLFSMISLLFDSYSTRSLGLSEFHIATSSSAVLPMFSRLMILPVNVPGTFKPLVSAESARYWISSEASRVTLGVQVPNPSILIFCKSRLRVANHQRWSVESSLRIESNLPDDSFKPPWGFTETCPMIHLNLTEDLRNYYPWLPGWLLKKLLVIKLRGATWWPAIWILP